MAYDSKHHASFSGRVKDLMRGLKNIQEIVDRLDTIYINETASGIDPAFVDTDDGTEQEFIDAIVTMRDFEKFLTGQAVTPTDHTSRISPFLQ